MELETHDRDKPTAFYDDLPTVQIPLSAGRAGLSVDNEFMSIYELPEAAAEAYTLYAEQGGNVRVYQCDDCGYLTDADAFSATSRHSYECGGCGRKTASAGLQRSGTASFTQVHGPYVEPDDEDHVDVLGVESDVNCPIDHGETVEGDGRRSAVNEEAAECELCVSNHPSHLGRLQSDVGGEITQSEMMHTAAEAVKEFREA